MNFITALELKTKFGTSWATDEDFDLYVDQINAWLLGQGIATVFNDDHKPLVLAASYFLARAAKEDVLYTSSDNTKSIKASAQSGTFAERTYFATAVVKNRWVKVAEDMLSPLISLAKNNFVFAIDKII